jgi:hypothetical protein
MTPYLVKGVSTVGNLEGDGTGPEVWDYRHEKCLLNWEGAPSAIHRPSHSFQGDGAGSHGATRAIEGALYWAQPIPYKEPTAEEVDFFFLRKGFSTPL